jgi:3-oxoacyl-[acyl-carrier protein] reductase
MVPTKVALVTGGGRGIGRSTALRLARDGFDVVISHFQEQTGEPVADAIRALGRKALSVRGDVSKSADVKTLFETGLKEFGRLDVLVTSAGIGEKNDFEDLSEELWDRVVDINAKGTFLCILEGAKPMIAQGFGRIITVGSHYAIEGAGEHVAYSASKFAVRGMTQGFAKQLAPHGITVNCVIPGYIWTDMWGADPEGYERESKKYVLLDKPGDPDYVASVISFLASDDAEYVTAATIQAGGGAPVF